MRQGGGNAAEVFQNKNEVRIISRCTYDKEFENWTIIFRQPCSLTGPLRAEHLSEAAGIQENAQVVLLSSSKRRVRTPAGAGAIGFIK